MLVPVLDRFTALSSHWLVKSGGEPHLFSLVWGHCCTKWCKDIIIPQSGVETLLILKVLWRHYCCPKRCKDITVAPSGLKTLFDTLMWTHYCLIKWYCSINWLGAIILEDLVWNQSCLRSGVKTLLLDVVCETIVVGDVVLNQGCWGPGVEPLLLSELLWLREHHGGG